MYLTRQFLYFITNHQIYLSKNAIVYSYNIKILQFRASIFTKHVHAYTLLHLHSLSTHLHTHTLSHTHFHTHTHTHTHIHTHTHTHTHTHSHTHTQHIHSLTLSFKVEACAGLPNCSLLHLSY